MKCFLNKMPTESPFKTFIILENLFGISRPHLIYDHKTRVICECIAFTVAIIIITATTIDIFSSDISIGMHIFQGLTGFELVVLALFARYQKTTSRKLERLDEYCQINAENLFKLNAKTNKIAVISIISFIIDAIGLKMLNVKNTVLIFLSVVFAAHDAELAYFYLLVERINARLGVLKYVSPNAGSRSYGYLLIYTSHLSEQCTLRLLLLLGMALLTTVSYQFLLIVADAEIFLYLSLYLVWRESRSMYSLWMMCNAITRNSDICKELALHLVGRLTTDKNIIRSQNQYKLLQRWYSVVITQQPCFISGTILTIGLSTPVLVLDLSINYMLIIVQMYLAYK